MEKIEFDSDYLAEYIYEFALDNYVIQDSYDVQMSICEFVKWYRFPEFRKFMKDKYNIEVVK